MLRAFENWPQVADALLALGAVPMVVICATDTLCRRMKSNVRRCALLLLAMTELGALVIYLASLRPRLRQSLGVARRDARPDAEAAGGPTDSNAPGG